MIMKMLKLLKVMGMMEILTLISKSLNLNMLDLKNKKMKMNNRKKFIQL